MNTRGDKIWIAFCTALLCWGVVSCSMKAAENHNAPQPDPWANWANYCRQVGGTYVPPVETNTAQAGELVPVVFPICRRPDGSEMTFTPRNRENLDVEPADPGEREPFR